MSERIKTFEEACTAQGLDPNTVLPDVTCLPESDRKAVTCFAMMCIINRSLNTDPETNQEWKPDWNDSDQEKYYPWFDVDEKPEGASGFGLSYDGDFGCGNARAYLGVRLFYRDSETAIYAGETFIELYENMILLPK